MVRLSVVGSVMSIRGRVLMRVDDKEVLIGVSPGQISVIDRWSVGPQPLPAAADPVAAAMERS